jgi:IS1 family transposase
LQGFARFFKKPCNLCEKYAQYRASIQNKVLFCRNEGAYQVRRNIKTLDFRLKTVYYLVNTIRKERLNNSLRVRNRRFVRKTCCFSKKDPYHEAAIKINANILVQS